MLNIFLYICWPSVYFPWRNVYSGPLPIFNWIVFVSFLVLSCMSSLDILNISPSLHVSLANVFSHSVGCLFILLMASSLCKGCLVCCGPFCLFSLWFPWPKERYPKWQWEDWGQRQHGSLNQISLSSISKLPKMMQKLNSQWLSHFFCLFPTSLELCSSSGSSTR